LLAGAILALPRSLGFLFQRQSEQTKNYISATVGEATVDVENNG
jgi:hypothetical protein